MTDTVLLTMGSLAPGCSISTLTMHRAERSFQLLQRSSHPTGLGPSRDTRGSELVGCKRTGFQEDGQAMSIDVSVRLFFPITSAPAALKALAEILHSETGKVLVITLPEGSAYSIPIESAFQNDLSESHTLEVGTSIRGGFEVW